LVAYHTFEQPSLTAIPALAPEHAVENGDPTYTLRELEALHTTNNNNLRRLASACNSDQLRGKGFSTPELVSYFAEPCQPEQSEIVEESDTNSVEATTETVEADATGGD